MPKNMAGVLSKLDREPTSTVCCIAPAMIATGIVLTYTRRRGIPKHTLATFADR